MSSNLSLQLLGKFKIIETVVVESSPVVNLTDCQVPASLPVVQSSATVCVSRSGRSRSHIAKKQKFGTDEELCTICCKRCNKEETRNFEGCPETWRGFVETLLSDENKSNNFELASSKYQSLPFCINCYSGIKYLVETFQQIKTLEEQVKEMKMKFQNVVKLTFDISQQESQVSLNRGVLEEWNYLRKAIASDMYPACTPVKRIQHQLKIIVEKPTVPPRNDATIDFDDNIPVLSPAASMSGTSFSQEDYNYEEDNLIAMGFIKLEAEDTTNQDTPQLDFDKTDELLDLGQGSATLKMDADSIKIGSTKKIKKQYPPGINGNTKGMRNPRSFDKIPPEKLSQNPAAIQWRKLRAEHPEMSQRELKRLRKELAAERRRNEKVGTSSSTSAENAQKVISYTKGLDNKRSFVHIPPEKLSQTKPAIAYRKLRLQHPEKSQREMKAMLKKTTAEKLGHVKTVIMCKITEDGRIFYKNIEIKKTENGMYSCSLCENKRSACRTNVMLHINRAHMPHSYKCSKCGKAFYYKNGLQEHVRQCQRKEKLVCHICGATFNQNPARLTHIRVVHKGIKPHTCEYCGKAFGMLKDLNIHIRRHTGERPFKCPQCGDTFIEKQSMKKHIRIKHPETVEKVENMNIDETLNNNELPAADPSASASLTPTIDAIASTGSTINTKDNHDEDNNSKSMTQIV